MIYAIGGLKEGIGKTTTATNLGLYLANEQKRKVAFIDADPEGSASEFMGKRSQSIRDENLKLIKTDGENLKAEIEKIRHTVDDIVIDCVSGPDQKVSLEVADRYVIPFPADQPDLWAMWTLASIEEFITEIRYANEDLQSYAFATVNGGKDALNPDLVNALEKSQLLEYINRPVHRQGTFYQAMMSGHSIYDFMPRDEQAINELTGLFKELTA